MREQPTSCSYTSLRNNPIIGAVTIFLIALMVRFAYLSRILGGSLRTPPDYTAYLEACQVLYTDPIAIAGIRKGIPYLGFTLPYCSVRALTGGSNVSWAVIQVLLSAVTAVLVYYIGVRVINMAAGVVAGLGFAVLFEAFRFVVFMLSETVFIFTLVLSMWALAYHRDKKTKMSVLFVVLSFVWLIITRPFGFPIVAGWLCSDLLSDDSEFRIDFLPRRIAIAGVVGLPTILGLFTNLFTKLNQFGRSFREGWVYYKGNWDSPLALYEYTPRPPVNTIGFFLSNIDHVIQIMCLRLLVFYIPFVPRLSRGAIPYTAFNAIVLIPLLVSAFLGIVRSIRQKSVSFSLFGTPILVVTGITMLMFVSSSWRYRAPLAPSFALLTGYFLTTDPRVVNRFRASLSRLKN